MDSIKVILAKMGLDFLSKIKISLAAIVFAFIFLTPVFAGVTDFVQTVYANTRQLQEHNLKLRKLDAMDDKMSAIMIEQGLQKELRAIESRYKQQTTGE